MKRKLFLLSIACLCLVFALCGCGSKSDSSGDGGADTTTSAELTPESAQADVAAYFSSHSSELLTAGDGSADWVVIAYARSDCKAPDKFFDKFYALLEQQVTEAQGVLDDTKYTVYSRSVLALTAMGKDPHDVGGYDLLEPLADVYTVASQGLNGSIWALLALNSGHYTLESRPDAAESYLSLILNGQLDNGGFALGEGADADIDITAMALQALAPYRDREDVSAAIDRGLTYLSESQSDDGSYLYYGSANAESICQVITAVSSLGIGIDDDRFVKNGNTLFDALMEYRLDDGSYFHTAEMKETNLMASEQAFYALTALIRNEKGESALYAMAD